MRKICNSRDGGGGGGGGRALAPNSLPPWCVSLRLVCLWFMLFALSFVCSKTFHFCCQVTKFASKIYCVLLICYLTACQLPNEICEKSRRGVRLVQRGGQQMVDHNSHTLLNDCQDFVARVRACFFMPFFCC